MSNKIRRRGRPASNTNSNTNSNTDKPPDSDADPREERDTDKRVPDNRDTARPRGAPDTGTDAPDTGKPDRNDPDTIEPNAPAPNDPSPPDQNDGGASASCSPEGDRLEIVYVMTVLGMTQKEIAGHFNVVPRTVRNWQKKFANMTFEFVANFNPAMELERALINLTAAEVRLRNLSEDALACSDRAIAIRCARELARLTEQRIRLLSRLGGFERLNLAHADTEDAGKRRAEGLFKMLEAIDASITKRPGDISSEDD